MLRTRCLRRSLESLFCALVLLSAPTAIAASGVVGDTPIYSTSYLIQVLGALLLVFGCLFGLLFLLKKVNGTQVSDRKAIRIVGSLKVGAREKILLIQADERQLLVGVAAGGVRTLHVFDSVAGGAGDQPGEGADFATVLGSAEHSQGAV